MNAGLEAAMSVSVHGRIPAEVRVIKIGNTERRRKDAEMLIYLEPVLRDYREHYAHPAFSDLFIMCEYREAEKCLLVWRRGDVEEEACVAYGFSDAEVDYVFETDRSEVLKKCEGIFSIDKAFSRVFSCAGGTPVIPCVALKTRLSLRGGENESLVFIQCAGRNREEALSRFLLVRNQSVQSMMKSSWEAAGNMSASINCGAEENRLLTAIIPKVLYDAQRSRAAAESARLNSLGIKDLWSLSISGDDPIVVCSITGVCDVERAISHVKARRAAAIKGAKYDLCIIYSEGGAYDGAIRSALEETGAAHEGGVFLIDSGKVGFEKVRLLKAASVYCDECGVETEADEPFGSGFVPVIGEPVSDAAEIESYVPGGGFEKEAFAAWPQKSSSPLPWCFPLANRTFGTLVSDSSLGFSFFLNSRLNQLTRWSNDYMTDNLGERLFVRCGDRYFDLIRGGFVRFGRGFAEYSVRNGCFESDTEVCVHEKLPVKIVTVTLRNRSTETVEAQLAYYTEPFPDSGFGSVIKTFERGGVMTAVNPFAGNLPGTVFCVSCSENSRFVTGKEGFYSGRWNEKSGIRERPCVASIADVKLKAGERKKISFYLSAAESEDAATYPHRLFTERPAEVKLRADGGAPAFEILTPSEGMNRLVNTFLP
ncbi:MAG: hypothetical protein J6252_00995, partial [Clostridia bacterium]|nr:hypothetical protein [Clostridia bacterium]